MSIQYTESEYEDPIFDQLPEETQKESSEKQPPEDEEDVFYDPIFDQLPGEGESDTEEGESIGGEETPASATEKLSTSQTELTYDEAKKKLSTSQPELTSDEEKKAADERPWYENIGRLTKAGLYNQFLGGFYKLASEVARPVSKDAHGYLKETSDWNREEAERLQKGITGWEKDIGNALPSAIKISGVVVGSGLVPVAAPALSSAYLTDMGISVGGNSLADYDEYKKGIGEDPREGGNQYERWGIALSSAGSEVFTERFLGGISRYMPKPIKKAVGGDLLKKMFRTKAGRESLESAIKTYAKQTPGIVKRGLKEGADLTYMTAGEAGEEGLTEVGLLAIETFYKKAEDDPDLQEWISRVTDAARSGALMTGMVAPVRGGTRNYIRNKRRSENGIPIVMTKDGETAEYLGEKDGVIIGETQNGDQIEISPDEVADQAFVTPKEYQEYQEGLEQGMDQQVFEQAASIRNKNTGNIQAFYTKNQDKDKEEPLFVVDQDGENAVVVDPNNNFERRMVPVSELEDAGTSVDFESFVNEQKEYRNRVLDHIQRQKDGEVKFKQGDLVEAGGTIGQIMEVSTDGTMIVNGPEGSISVAPDMKDQIRPATIIEIDDAQVSAVETERGLEVQQPFNTPDEAEAMAQRLNEIYQGKKVFEIIEEQTQDSNGQNEFRVIGTNVNNKGPDAAPIEQSPSPTPQEPDNLGGAAAEMKTVEPGQQETRVDNNKQTNTPVITAGENQYNVTQIEDGTYQIGDAFGTSEEAEQVIGSLNSRYNGKLEFEIKTKSGADLFSPNAYTIVAKELKLSEQQGKDSEPIYSIEGKPVSRGMARLAIKRAKRPEDLQPLGITGDEELQGLIDEKFPQPEYSFEGDQMNREEALAAIGLAENIEDLEGIVIKNDPELEQAVADKFTPLSALLGSKVKKDGIIGELIEDEGRYYLKKGDKDYEIANKDMPPLGLGIEVVKQSINPQMNEDGTFTIRGKKYTAQTNDNGSITQLVDERGNVVTNERWLINAEIERSKQETPDIRKQEEEEGVQDEEAIIVDGVLNKNMNEAIAEILDNGVADETTEQDFLQAKLWAEDAIAELENQDGDYVKNTAESIYDFLNILENEHTTKFPDSEQHQDQRTEENEAKEGAEDAAPEESEFIPPEIPIAEEGAPRDTDQDIDEVLEKSEDANEVANAYREEVRHFIPYEKLEEWQKVIADGVHVEPNSFKRSNDKANITQGLGKRFLRKDGMALEELAGSLGFEGTSEDLGIVSDFMIELVNNPSIKRKTTDRQKALAAKYKKLTGKSIKNHDYYQKDEAQLDRENLDLENNELNPKFTEQYAAFNDDNGEVDIDKLAEKLESDPKFFTEFPFGLTTDEYNELKVIINGLRESNTGSKREGLQEHNKADSEGQEKESPGGRQGNGAEISPERPTAAQQERIDGRIKAEVTDKQKSLIEQYEEAKGRRQTLKNKMDKGLNEQKGLDMDVEDKNKKPSIEPAGQLFDVPKDGSQKNIQNQLADANAELAAIEREMNDFTARKEPLKQEIKNAVLAQNDFEDVTEGAMADKSAINKRRKSQEARIELQNKPKTRVNGLNMGENQAQGVYFSTEQENRYETEENPAVEYEVEVENPAVFDQNQNEFAELQLKLLQENKDQFKVGDFAFGYIPQTLTLDELGPSGTEKLAAMVTAHLQEEGYDSISFQGQGENELIVFDRSKIRRKDSPVSPDHFAAMEQAAKDASKEFGIPVKVVDDPGTLPKGYMFSKADKGKIQGFYDPETGNVYVVPANVLDLNTARKVILHEVLGHRGLRKALGEDKIGPILDRVYDGMNEVDREGLEEIYGSDKRTIAEEYIASLAVNYKRPGTLTRIGGRIRQIIKDMFGISYSTNDIMYLLSRSENAIKKDKSIGYVSEEGSNIGRPLQAGERAIDHGMYHKVTGDTSSAAELREKGDRFREITQDFMLPVKRLQQEILRRGGNVEWFRDAYNQENRSYGITMTAMERMGKGKVVPMMKAVYDVIQSSKDEKLDELELYLMAKHAPERNKKITKKRQKAGKIVKGREGIIENWSGLSTEHANKITKEFEANHDMDAINKMWEKIRALNNFTLERAFRDGRLSKETFQELTLGEDSYEYYVPLKGLKNTEEEENVWNYAGKNGGDGAGKLMKAKGRKSLANNPLQHMVEQAGMAIVQGEANKTKQYMYRLLKDNPYQDLAHIQKTYFVETGKIKEDGKKEYYIEYERPEQKLFDEKKVKTRYNSRRMSLNKAQDLEHNVDVWVNGELIIMRFENPDVANAINKKKLATTDKIDIEWVRNTIEGFGWGTRQLVQNFTAKNPAFIIPNTQRDVMYAALAHAIKPDGDVTTFVKRLKTSNAAMTAYNKWEKAESELDRAETPEAREQAENNLREIENNTVELEIKGPDGKRTSKTVPIYKLMNDFKENGGETGFVHMKELDKVQKDIEQELKKAGRVANSTGVNEVFFNAEGQNRFFEGVGKSLEAMAQRSENLARLATYITSLEMGKAPADAATDAKNTGANFNRKGEMSPMVGNFIGFSNAAIQGFENIGRLAYENKGNFVKGAASMYALGMASAFLNHMAMGLDDDDKDKDWYSNVNSYIKHNYFVVGYGKGRYISIPLLHGFRAFHGMGVSSYENMFLDTSDKIGYEDAGGKQMSIDALNLAVDMGSPVNPVEWINKDDVGLMTIIKPIAPMVLTPWLDLAENRDFADRSVLREPYTKGLEEQTANAGLFKRDVNFVAKYFTDQWFQINGGNPETYARYPLEEGELQKPLPWYEDINPSGVEHLVTYYLGGRGQFFNNVMKTGAGLVEGASAMISGEDNPFNVVDKNTIPIVRRYNRQAYEYAPYERLSQLRKEVDAYNYNITNMSRENERVNRNPRYMRLEALLKGLDKKRTRFKHLREKPGIEASPRELQKIRDEETAMIKEFLKKYDR